MLGAHMKKNIIIDPSLPPALVTMTLKNVPLSEVFAYLMKTYDVSYHMVGKDTIAVGTVDGLAKISEGAGAPVRGAFRRGRGAGIGLWLSGRGRGGRGLVVQERQHNEVAQ